MSEITVTRSPARRRGGRQGWTVRLYAFAAASSACLTLGVAQARAAAPYVPVAGSPFTLPGLAYPDAVAFSPAGDLLAAVNGDGTVSVYSVAADTVSPDPQTVTVGNGSVPIVDPVAIAFNPTGDMFAVANQEEGTVSVFHVSDGTVDVAPQTFISGSAIGNDGNDIPFNGSNPVSVSFSPDGNLLAVANLNDDVSVYSVRGGVVDTATPQVFSPGSQTPTDFYARSQEDSVAFSPTGDSLAVGNNDDGKVFVYPMTGDTIEPNPQTLNVAVTGETGLAFNPAGTLLAVLGGSDGTEADGDGTVSAYRVSGGTVDPTPQVVDSGGTDPVSLTFNAPGGLLAVVNRLSVDSVALFSASGDTLASTPQTLTPSDWGASAGAFTVPFPVAFSPANGMLAIGDVGNGSIRVLQASPRPTIASPEGGSAYAVGQIVPTSFSCAAGIDGSPVSSCVDSNGAGAGDGTGALDTQTPGTHTYTVTAISQAGGTGTASISYTVTAPPATSTGTAPDLTTSTPIAATPMITPSRSTPNAASLPAIITPVTTEPGLAIKQASTTTKTVKWCRDAARIGLHAKR